MSGLRDLWCRLFGRSCSAKRPPSRALLAEMQDRGRKAEEQTTEIRRARSQGIEGAFFPPPRREGNHHAR